MHVRTIILAAPLVLGAGEKGSTESPDAGKGQQSGAASDSVPGHGQAAGALGNSSDTSGAKGGGGAGTNSGTAGAKSETGAGEKGETTSGRSADAAAPGGQSDKRGHEGHQTLTGKVSQLSDESVTIQSAQGERHTLKIVPQTKFTVSGKDAQRAQLAEGQQVRASFAEHAGEQIAVRIEAAGDAPKASGGADAKKSETQKTEKK